MHLRQLTLTVAAIAAIAPLAACNSGSDTTVSGSTETVTATTHQSSTPAASRTNASPTTGTSAAQPPAATTTAKPPAPPTTKSNTPGPARDRTIHIGSRAGFTVAGTRSTCQLNSGGVVCNYVLEAPAPGLTCKPANAVIMTAKGEVGGDCATYPGYVPNPGDSSWARGLGLKTSGGVPVLNEHVFLVDDASNITCRVSTTSATTLYCAYQEGVISMTVSPSRVAFTGATPKQLTSPVEENR